MLFFLLFKLVQHIPFPMVKLFHTLAQALSDNNTFFSIRILLSRDLNIGMVFR
jgi:hypothetical protein